MRRSLPLLLSPYFFHGAVHPGLVTPSSHVTTAVAQHVAPPKVKLQAFLTKDTCYGFTLGESTFTRSGVLNLSLCFDLVLSTLSEKAISCPILNPFNIREKVKI